MRRQATRWLQAKKQWQCSECGFRTGLRSGTVMQDSNLPVSKWLHAMYLMTFTRKGISALELQRQLELGSYKAAWYMAHKLRSVMSVDEHKRKLDGQVEMDDAFFTVVKSDRSSKSLSRGRGSERKHKVLVMVESQPVKTAEPHRPKRKMGKLKMLAVERLDSETINTGAAQSVTAQAHIHTDGYTSFSKLKSVVRNHTRQTVPSRQAHIALPWVHSTIGN